MAALNKENLSFQAIYYHIYGSFGQNISASNLHSSEVINTNSEKRPDSSTPHSVSEFDGYDHSTVGEPTLTQFYGTMFSAKAEICGNDPETKYWHDGSGESPAIGDRVYADDRGSEELEEGYVGWSTTGGFQYAPDEGVTSFYLCRKK